MKNLENGYNFYIPDNFEPLITSTDVIKNIRFVEDEFKNFYVERKYLISPPGNLLAQDDSSVIFTGATITPLKPYLFEGVPVPGICAVQKCMRTKRLDEMYDLSNIPEWTHYFTMCGILSSPGREEEIVDEISILLFEKFGLSKNNIVVEANSHDSNLFSYLERKNFTVIKDAHPNSYYAWSYGIDNISGRGVNFLLKSNTDNQFRDLGNLINIQDGQGNSLAIEFGFGVESLLSKTMGFKKPMEASAVSSVIPFKEGVQEKFVNAFVAALVMFHHDIEPGRGKEKHVLKKLVKGISYLRRKVNISLEQIQNWGDAYEMVEFSSYKHSGEKLVRGIQLYEDQVSKFIDYTTNQVHAHKLREQINDKLRSKIINQGKSMGVAFEEIIEILDEELGVL